MTVFANLDYTVETMHDPVRLLDPISAGPMPMLNGTLLSVMTGRSNFILTDDDGSEPFANDRLSDDQAEFLGHAFSEWCEYDAAPSSCTIIYDR